MVEAVFHGAACGWYVKVNMLESATKDGSLLANIYNPVQDEVFGGGSTFPPPPFPEAPASRSVFLTTLEERRNTGESAL